MIYAIQGSTLATSSSINYQRTTDQRVPAEAPPYPLGGGRQLIHKIPLLAMGDHPNSKSNVLSVHTRCEKGTYRDVF